MTILFDTDPTFAWPVTVKIPDQGHWQTLELEVTFALLTQAAIETFLNQKNGEITLLQHIVRDVKDADHPTLDDAQRARLIGYPFAQRALLGAYQIALLGEQEKNSAG